MGTKTDQLAQILYEDACDEVRWPKGASPWDTLEDEKKVIWRERAGRIVGKVDNLFGPLALG